MQRRNERGMMVAVETAIILPVLLLMVGLLVVAAGQGLASLAVTSAAAQAARAASIERDPGTAAASARQVAAVSLAESGLECRNSTIGVDTGGLLAPLGSVASVSVTLSCEVAFGVGMPGLPTSRVLTATQSSPVDSFRSR